MWAVYCSTLHTLYCTVHTVYCSLHTIPCTLHAAQYFGVWAGSRHHAMSHCLRPTALFSSNGTTKVKPPKVAQTGQQPKELPWLYLAL